MRILGIDTATPTASVALVEDGQLVVEDFSGRIKGWENSSAQTKGNHAEIILPLIRALLSQAGIALNDLSGIAVSIGPGSFTGLRIALATVKGIAYDSGLPVVGVSTLLANAARVNDADGVVCSLLDARKQEVYAALFRRSGESLNRLSPDAVMAIRLAIELILRAGAKHYVIIGNGAIAYKKLLLDSLGGSARISAGDEYKSVAAQVAELAWGRFLTATTDDLGALVPLYLRASEAESKRNF